MEIVINNEHSQPNIWISEGIVEVVGCCAQDPCYANVNSSLRQTFHNSYGKQLSMCLRAHSVAMTHTSGLVRLSASGGRGRCLTVQIVNVQRN